MRGFTVCLLWCAGLCCVWPAGAAPARATWLTAAVPGPGASPLSAALALPDVEWLDADQQAQAAVAALRSSPAMVLARRESQTRYERLNASQAAAVARSAFPELLEQAQGGPPPLPAGARATRLLSATAEQLVLPSGEHAVVEGEVPIAHEVSPGRLVPIDLGLRAVGGSLEPHSAIAGVRIHARLASGAQLVGAGVSLTPIDASGSPLEGTSSVIAGTSVFFANTQTDTDTSVKPTMSGFEEDSLLRSVDSPQRLYFRIGMPAGARLERLGRAPALQVVRAGRTIATLPYPTAVDAEGTAVPVATDVSGDTLALTVDDRAGQYRYPIEVDPEVVDQEKKCGASRANWASTTLYPAIFEFSGCSEIKDPETSLYEAGESGKYVYTTQGESHIFEFSAGVKKEYGADQTIATIGLGSPAQPNEGEVVILRWNENEHSEQIDTTRAVTASDENNRAFFEVTTIQSGLNGFEYTGGGEVYIEQEKGPTARIDTTDATLEGQPNAAAGEWIKGATGELAVDAFDPGIGADAFSLKSPNKSGWGTGFVARENSQMECAGYIDEGSRLIEAPHGVQCNECDEHESECLARGHGGGGHNAPLMLPLSRYAALPEGEDTVEVSVEDGAGLSAKTTAIVKVDSSPPHNLTLTGLGTRDELTEGEYRLKGEATGGAAGMKSLALAIDGREVGSPSQGCSSTCTAKGEWVISGREIGVGEHKLTLTATDNAGNKETLTDAVTVHHVASVPLGPGSVNPESGEVTLGATDVSIPVPGSGLNVGATYRSGVALGAAAAAGGPGGSPAAEPLGSQWSLNVGGQESVTRTPSGNVTLNAASGGRATFTATGEGNFASPTGDTNLTLNEVKNEKGEPEYVLKDAPAGVTTRFTAGGAQGVFKPSKQEGTLASQTVRYYYQTVEGVAEPSEALAPEPAGVSCGKEIKELKPGCRALGFEYATETTAKGEKPSEWKAYKGRLKEILYWAYNPTSKELKPIPVAEFAYDAQGRLRAEWNPQITPNLKTTYGYDAEGHVTAVSPPGQEPWLLHYGTIPDDDDSARLLSLVRPAAASVSQLKATDEDPAPVKGSPPTLSSTKPAVGTKLTVSSEGTWSNSPLLYTYKWEDCNAAGGECTPIPGAVNQSYYPAATDEGHALAAQVTAYNASGAVVAETSATAPVASGTPSSPAPEPPSVGTSSVWTLAYQVPLSGDAELPTMTAAELKRWGQTDEPVEASAIFPPDTPMGWPAKSYKHATIEYLDKKGRTVNVATPSGGLATTEYNAENDVIRSLSADNRATALKETCESSEKCKSAELAKSLSTENTYEESGSEPGSELLTTVGPQHVVTKRTATEEARAKTVYRYDENAPTTGGPYHLVTTKTEEGVLPNGRRQAGSERTTRFQYSGTGSQEDLGWKLREPTATIVNPSGLALTHVTEFEPATGYPIATLMPAATGKSTATPVLEFGSLGGEPEELDRPEGVTLDAHGDVWVADSGGSRIDEFSATGKFIESVGFGVSNGEETFETCTSSCREGIAGDGDGQFSAPEGLTFARGDLYVADEGNDRIEELNEAGEYVAQFGKKGTEAGDLEKPTAVAVNAAGDIFVGEEGNDRIDEYSSKRKFVHTAGFGVSNGEAEFEICKKKCRAGIAGPGTGQFSGIEAIALSSKKLYVSEWGNSRVQELTEKLAPSGDLGTSGEGEGQISQPAGIATNPTNGNLYVVNNGDDNITEFTAAGAYVGKLGRGGGEGIVVNAAGAAYVVGEFEEIQEWLPTNTGNQGAHETKTIYYTTEPNSAYGNCGKHPEWAGLVCETRPGAQPETGGLPELPVTTIAAYNVYDEPTVVEEAVGTKVRTKTDTYDAAGRLKTASTTSNNSALAALPTVTYGYTTETGAETGALTTQSTAPPKGEPETLTSVYNTLGQLISYTDADKNTSTFEWDVDGRIQKTNDGKGTQTYTYNEAGLVGELVDSSHAGMRFTATYDVEGNMLTESYPNGMLATYTYNATGAPVALEYKKTTHCSEEKEECKWFTDSVVPSIHGEWMEQSSTFSKQIYRFDKAGRLVRVESTPTGKGCTTHNYVYDEDGNRTALTTHEPSSTGECVLEAGGALESHSYDSADRLVDAGVEYNPFGDISSLPAADAGGASLKSAYYVDNQVQSQTQCLQAVGAGSCPQQEETVGYNLDPADRAAETVSTGPKNSDVISHYMGSSDTPAWTESKPAGETTRNIPGINGQLVAIQYNNEAPVLQLANLHGDIVATASLSETATELSSKADTSEFGVPSINLPPKYSWLGAIEIPTELPSGVAEMGVRSYVPQLGRFLQPDPVPGGSADAYSYTFGNPLNTSDPSGAYTATIDEFDELHTSALAAQAAQARAAEIRAAEEAAARAAAELAAENAAEYSRLAGGPGYAAEQFGGEEEWWYEEEWYEEGWEYEYASYRHGGESGKREVPVESAVLYQPLGEGSVEGGQLGLGVPVCGAEPSGPCARTVVLTDHIPRGVLRLACAGAALFSIRCGGDDWLQRQAEYTARGPVETPISRPVDDEDDRFCACNFGGGDDDPGDFIGDDDFIG
jgi:RHS repeat-associated protein